MRSLASLVALAALLLASCTSVTAPAFPEDELVPYEPLPQYAQWWAQLEECSGVTGELDAISWYSGEGFPIQVGDRLYYGIWWQEGNRIAVQDPEDGPTVRHEMLHALLGVVGHPPEMFVARCGSLVHYAP